LSIKITSSPEYYSYYFKKLTNLNYVQEWFREAKLWGTVCMYIPEVVSKVLAVEVEYRTRIFLVWIYCITRNPVIDRSRMCGFEQPEEGESSRVLFSAISEYWQTVPKRGIATI
jgi:hypothetical protein